MALAERRVVESHARTILKAVTYRVGGFLLTSAVAWALTHRADVAATIGLADTAVKLVAYYLHERIWLKIKFGRQKPPEYQI